MKLEKIIRKNPLLIAIVVFALAVILLGSSFQLAVREGGIITPGWEIYNQIAGVRCAAGVKTGAGEFTYPNEIGAAQWKVDVDDPAYGEPTIMIQTSDIRHVDFTGITTPNDQPAQERTVVRSNHTYYLDYHIYMLDVTIRTVADKVQHGSAGIFPLVYPRWYHETSWQRTTSEEYVGQSSQVGKPFQGGAYVKFVISPWRGGSYHTAPEDYVVQGAWSGVMNSYIQSKQQGQIENQWNERPNPSGDAPLRSVGGLDNGAQVNMYSDTGSFGQQAPTTNWDTEVTPDTRIQSTVVLYLPVQLEAGAYLTTDFWGGATELNPCDAYIKYTVRVDVLQTHDFVLETAYKPPELNIPTDYFTWAKGFWDGLFSSPNFYFFIIIIAILVGLWIVFRGKKGSGGERKSRYAGLSMFDWAVVGVLALLTFIPDPTDLLDVGLPIVEPIAALGYWYLKRRGGRKA